MKNLNVKKAEGGEIPASRRSRPSTAPPSLARPPSQRPSGPKHDSLCIETYRERHALTIVDKNLGKTLLDQTEDEVTPLSHCYCNCGSCWLPTGRTRNRNSKTQPEAGLETGRCICKSCPCWITRLVSSPPTRSTKDSPSFKTTKTNKK